MDGICTLGNDRVYDQIIALLNSIEVIAGKDMSVCIYPYDDNTEKLAQEVAKRPNVQLYDNVDSIQKWDKYVRSIWDVHPTAKQVWQKIDNEPYHRVGTHRRYCAFDAPFDRYIYMDADTLLMSPTDAIFDLLESHDCIVYDFQHKDPTHVYNVKSPKLETIFPSERVEQEIFCSGFYASKKDLFTPEMREDLLSHLKQGEAEILYPMAPDQTIINYMMMRSGCSVYNLALNLPPDNRTGCCVTSEHFQEKDHILYDKNNRLTYIHYIGLSSRLFKKVSEGENITFPYRDLFLYYRYLHEPEKLPKFTTKPKAYNSQPNFLQKITRKLGISSKNK
ncbi:MAG: sugar transferase [Xenococcaceae cyanobacterium MO_167.B27]|nr:sugar transferase [Xenococcaceae cyanobacterium MO_167.B27]